MKNFFVQPFLFCLISFPAYSTVNWTHCLKATDRLKSVTIDLKKTIIKRSKISANRRKLFDNLEKANAKRNEAEADILNATDTIHHRPSPELRKAYAKREKAEVDYKKVKTHFFTIDGEQDKIEDAWEKNIADWKKAEAHFLKVCY